MSPGGACSCLSPNTYVCALNVLYNYISYICLVFVQVERTASAKAVSAALAEEREKHDKIVADMKVL